METYDNFRMQSSNLVHQIRRLYAEKEEVRKQKEYFADTVLKLLGIMEDQKSTIDKYEKKKSNTNGTQTEITNDVTNKSTQYEVNLPSLLSISAKKDSKPNVLLLCDRHGSYMNEFFKPLFNKDEVEVLIEMKPTARIEGIIEDFQEVIAHCTVKDYVVVIGGANNIKRRRDIFTMSKIVDNFEKIIETSKNTNVIIFTIPFRYISPYLNIIIENLNHEIYNMARKYNHVEVFCTNNLVRRRDYVGNGIYLKRTAKKYICKMLSETINEMCKKRTGKAIFCSKYNCGELKPDKKREMDIVSQDIVSNQDDMLFIPTITTATSEITNRPSNASSLSTRHITMTEMSNGHADALSTIIAGNVGDQHGATSIIDAVPSKTVGEQSDLSPISTMDSNASKIVNDEDNVSSIQVTNTASAEIVNDQCDMRSKSIINIDASKIVVEQDASFTTTMDVASPKTFDEQRKVCLFHFYGRCRNGEYIS